MINKQTRTVRKPGDKENNPVVETVSLEDLRYSLYGGTPPARPATTTPVVRRAAPVRRPARPVQTQPVRPATNSVEVVRGTTNSNYEVGGYGS